MLGLGKEWNVLIQAMTILESRQIWLGAYLLKSRLGLLSISLQESSQGEARADSHQEKGDQEPVGAGADMQTVIFFKASKF